MADVEVLRAPWARAHDAWFQCRLNQNYYRDLCSHLTRRDHVVRCLSVGIAICGGAATALFEGIPWAAPIGALASGLLTTWTIVSTDVERARIASTLMAQYVALEGEFREIYYQADDASKERLADALVRLDNIHSVEADRSPLVDTKRLARMDKMTRQQFSHTSVQRPETA